MIHEKGGQNTLPKKTQSSKQRLPLSHLSAIMYEPLWTADTGRTALKPYLFNWFAKFQPLFQFQGCCLFLLSNIYVPCALCLAATSSLEPEVCISQLQHIRRTTLRTAFSDHFWTLRCQKTARRCGPLLQVEMLKKCTPFWREAHFQVKSVKICRVRTTFARSDVVLNGKGLCTLPKVSKT